MSIRMRLTVVWISLLVIGASSSFAVAEVSKNSPKLVCSEPIYDFGRWTNESASEVVHSFVLRNKGRAELNIQKVQTGCGCTTVRLGSMTLEPGEKTELTVKLSLRGRSGKQQKSIYVQSNDPENPMFQLQIVGETGGIEPQKDMVLSEGLKIEPGRINFGNIEEGAEVQRKLTITSTNDIPFQILGAKTSCPNLKAEVKEIEKGKRYIVEVRTVPPLGVGPHQSCIHVNVEDSRVREFEIPVCSRVVPELYFVPIRIQIPAEKEVAAGVSRYLCLRSRSKKTFQILSVESPIPEAKVDIRPDKSSNTYRIRISNLTPSEMIDGKMLRIKTNLGDGKEVAVPIVSR